MSAPTVLRPSGALAFSIRPRIDLRSGMVAGAAVDLGGRSDSIAHIAQGLHQAFRAWRGAGVQTPLAIELPAPSIADPTEAGHLDGSLNAAGLNPRCLGFEVQESALLFGGEPMRLALEKLRARGWSIALRGAPECPTPMGRRARAMFTELVTTTPNTLQPFFGLEDYEDHPLARRVFAAREAGLVITATTGEKRHDPNMLLIAGFDRAEECMPIGDILAA